MIETVNNITKTNPVLLDRTIDEIRLHLTNHFEWLNYAFGKAYTMTEYRRGEGKFIYPAFYNGNGEYKSLLPNDNYGNFSWFDIYDPQNVEYQNPFLPSLIFQGAIIFWINLQSIPGYDNNNLIYTEEIKNDILRLMTAPGFISDGNFTITKIYERFENIYKGYSIEKVYNSIKESNLQAMDKQFLLYPYAGMRFEFTAYIKEKCI